MEAEKATQHLEAGKPEPSVSSPHDAVYPITRPEMLAAIDYEIAQIEDEDKRPGWSKWALHGGIATLIWLALAELGPKSNLTIIGTTFLFGTYLATFVLLLGSTLEISGIPAPDQTKTYGR